MQMLLKDLLYSLNILAWWREEWGLAYYNFSYHCCRSVIKGST